MNHATRLANAHARIRSTFGQNAAAAQLYCWHSGAQIACYQPSGTQGRNLLHQILVKDDSVTIHATKASFTTVPQTGDTIQLGTTLATAQAYRISDIRTTHIRPFYEIELLDPNVATTAPVG